MSIVWFNGDFEPGTVPLDAGDRGFLLGDGLFETIAVRNGNPIWLADHMDRMENSAAELGIPFDRIKTVSGVVDVLQKSNAGSEVLRITLSRGKTGRGLASSGGTPSLLITLASFASTPLEPCRLKISSIRRNEHAPSSRLKTLSYIDAIMAAREVADEADEALMLNVVGNVASTTIANIFLLKDGKFITPSLDQGILSGITRQKIMALRSVVERPIAPNELYGADAVFLCNSLRSVRPVSQINGIIVKSQSLEKLHHDLIDLMTKGNSHEILH